MNLLHLLLAYSASHRARLLGHPEPANRIAIWVRDIFPALRRALDDPSTQISNSNLATAIMLTSIEIISPNTFEIFIPWRSHLQIARRMILARSEAQSFNRKDLVSDFLIRWFARLDVFGSLSGPKNERPLPVGDYWPTDDSEDKFQVDCILGCSHHHITLLARIRYVAGKTPEGDIRSWHPAKNALFSYFQEARMHRFVGCKNVRDDSLALLEMESTNTAFYWAGIIYLNRCILNPPIWPVEEIVATREIVHSLYKIRSGGTAEACLMLPLFMAGSALLASQMREDILNRLKAMEGSGMSHVSLVQFYMKPWIEVIVRFAKRGSCWKKFGSWWIVASTHNGGHGSK